MTPRGYVLENGEMIPHSNAAMSATANTGSAAARQVELLLLPAAGTDEASGASASPTGRGRVAPAARPGQRARDRRRSLTPHPVAPAGATRPLPPGEVCLRVEPRLRPAVALAGEQHAVVQAERAVLPELHRDGRDAEAGPVGRARHLADGIASRRSARPPSRARSGSRAGATAGSPRRRCGCRAGGSRNRRRPRPRSPASPARGRGSGGAGSSSESTSAAFGCAASSRPLVDSVLV